MTVAPCRIPQLKRNSELQTPTNHVSHIYLPAHPEHLVRSDFCVRHGAPSAARPTAGRPGTSLVSWELPFLVLASGLACLPLAVDKSKFRTCEFKSQSFRKLVEKHETTLFRILRRLMMGFQLFPQWCQSVGICSGKVLSVGGIESTLARPASGLHRHNLL